MKRNLYREMRSRMNRVVKPPLRRRLSWMGAAWVLALGALSAGAQVVNQTWTLKPGWNSIYLEVTPADAAVGHVFADPAIASVWEPKVRVNTVSFIQNQNEAPFNRGGWAVYVPAGHPESINNDLFSVRANHAYLVNVGGTSAVTLTLSGPPALRSLAFAPDTYTLRGFAVDPAAAPTFRSFFQSSPAHYDAKSGAMQRMYRLNNATAQWELVSPGDVMTRGVAYWVFTAGASTYMGPLAATPTVGDSLGFGAVAEEEDLVLQNLKTTPVTISVQDQAAGNRPLTYYFTDATHPVPIWLPLPPVYTTTLAGGATQRLRVGIQRSQMTADAYGTVLSVSDGAGSQLWVAVSAQRLASPRRTQTLSASASSGPASIPVALQAGLWVGDVSVNAVAETYNNLTNTTPTKAPFDLRLILHVTTNGVTRLLREVIEMYQNGTYTNNADGQRMVSQPGSYVLVTDDALLPQFTGVALRDGQPVGRRISTAGFDFDPVSGANFLTMTGTFGVSNTVGCTITLSPNTPTNPFLHRFHPDHDNLDASYQPIPANLVQEVYTVTRQLQLTFTGSDPTRQATSDYGFNEIGGTYQETLTGLHRNPLVARGIFHLRRIIDTPVLDQNQ